MPASSAAGSCRPSLRVSTACNSVALATDCLYRLLGEARSRNQRSSLGERVGGASGLEFNADAQPASTSRSGRRILVARRSASIPGPMRLPTATPLGGCHDHRGDRNRRSGLPGPANISRRRRLPTKAVRYDVGSDHRARSSARFEFTCSTSARTGLPGLLLEESRPAFPSSTRRTLRLRDHRIHGRGPGLALLIALRAPIGASADRQGRPPAPHRARHSPCFFFFS